MRVNLESVLDSRKRENRSPVGSVLLSFIIHIIVIIGLFVGADIFMSQPEFSSFISASLIPAKGLPDFQPGTVKATAKQPSSKSSSAVVKSKPSTKDAIKLPTIKKSKKKPAKSKKKRPETTKSTRGTSNSSSNKDSRSGSRLGLPDGQVGGRGTTRGAGTISSIGLEDFEYTWYSASVADILSRNWVKSIAPPSMRGTSVTVRFRINKDGSISDISLVRKSNVFSLDQEVIRAIQNSSPLPPLPRGFTGKNLVAQYEFVY